MLPGYASALSLRTLYLIISLPNSISSAVAFSFHSLICFYAQKKKTKTTTKQQETFILERRASKLTFRHSVGNFPPQD